MLILLHPPMSSLPLHPLTHSLPASLEMLPVHWSDHAPPPNTPWAASFL